MPSTLHLHVPSEPSTLVYTLQGVVVDAVMQSGIQNAILLPPLVSTQNGNSFVIVAEGTTCTVNVWSEQYTNIATWQCPSAASISATPALSASGTVLVVATTNGSVYGVNMAVGSQMASTLWGPVQLPFSVTKSAIIVGAFAWITADNGVAYTLAVKDGTLGSVSQPTCNGILDVFATPFTMLSNSGPSMVGVTGRGCVVALGSSGSPLWISKPFATNTTFVDIAHAPAVDYNFRQIYVSTSTRTLCCATLAGQVPCQHWPTSCTTFGEGSPLRPGVAVSPDNTAFHGGQVFMFDQSGIMYTVFSGSGAFLTSIGSNIDIPSAATGPVVIPNAMGNDINALVMITQQGVVEALYVGDGPVADDDGSSDDDSYGTFGPAWTLPIFPNGTNTQLINVTMDAFAISGSGAIFVPASDGNVYVVVAQHAAPNTAPESNIVIVICVVVFVAVTAIGLTIWCAIRHRRRHLELQRHPSMLEEDFGHYDEADNTPPRTVSRGKSALLAASLNDDGRL